MICVYGVTVVTTSLIWGKYTGVLSAYSKGIVRIIKCNVFSLYVIAVLIVIQNLIAFSRIQVFGSFLALSILELTLFTFFYWFLPNEKKVYFSKGRKSFDDFFRNSWFRLFNELFILTVSFLIVYYVRMGTIALAEQDQKILTVLYGVWLVNAIVTRKFYLRQYRKFFYFISPYFKSFIVSICLMAVFVFSNRFFSYSWSAIVYTLLLALVIELIYNSLYFLDVVAYKRRNFGKHKNLDKVIRHDAPNEPDENHTKINMKESSHLSHDVLANYPRLTKFIHNKSVLRNISSSKICIGNASQFSRLNGQAKSMQLFINTDSMNRIEEINDYLLKLYEKAECGIYFVGRLKTQENFREFVFAKYPKFLAYLINITNCTVRGILYRIKFLGRLYNPIQKDGIKRLSHVEILGRLYYCGFRVLGSENIQGATFFWAQKAGTPLTDKKPSERLIIQMERVGLGGSIIYLNKMRTMYPYSEFLQKYVHHKNKLTTNGKFKDDFRITEFGEFCRKYWLDELPQLINFIRGDIGLVGVRALSRHYFSLYPKDLQELRIKFKPGLIPPYYADMPKSFDEIVSSEKRYLEQKSKNPFITDLTYFYRTIHNILFKRARSG